MPKLIPSSRIFLLIFLTLPFTATADMFDGLFAQAYGSPGNPAVVFLHGGPGANSFSFEATTAPALAERGFYVIVFDQRGCGRSQRASAKDFTFANATKDVQTIIHSFHLHRPLLIGHSYGGTLAIKTAEAYPDEVGNLVLVDAPLDQRGMVANILDRAEEVATLRKQQTEVTSIQQLRQSIFQQEGYKIDANKGGEVFKKAVAAGLYYPKNSTKERDEKWRTAATLPNAKLLNDSQSPPYVGLVNNEGWLTKNTIPSLKELRARTYAIIGADDGLFSPAQAKAIEQSLPQGHYDLVMDASHNVYVDRQDEFLDFVQKAAKSQR